MYMKAFLAPIFVQVLIALGSIVIQAIEVNSRHHHIPAHLASFHYKYHRYSHKNQIEGQYRRFRNYRPRSLCIRGGDFEYKEKSPTVKYSLYKSVAVFLTSIVGKFYCFKFSFVTYVKLVHNSARKVLHPSYLQLNQKME